MTDSRMTLRGLAWLLLAGGLQPSMPVIAETAGAPLPPSAEATETATQTTTGAESAPPAPDAGVHQPNLVGPTGATGVIRRSDRRQDRRAGDPRIER